VLSEEEVEPEEGSSREGG